MSRIVNLPGWLEEYPDLYVQLIRNPIGIGFPDKEFPETISQSVQETIRVNGLGQVLRKHIEWNIWRSWQVFSDELCSNAMGYVPLFIDIDNEEHNLEDAYNLTRACLDWFERTNQCSSLDHIRVVFSGMKGFHIEAIPTQPVDNQAVRQALLVGLQEMGFQDRGVSNCFLNGTIDPGHDFIRLTGSYNSWKENNELKTRKVISLSLYEFRMMRLENILEKSDVNYRLMATSRRDSK